jgi:death-on-curing protein
MTEIKYLEFDGVVAIHQHIIENSGGALGIRDKALLISALQRPKNLAYYDFGGDIFDLAATLAVGIAMNHPFFDGNKRCALMCAVMFLSKNVVNLKKMNIPRFRKLMVDIATHKVSDSDVANFLRDLEE